MPLDDYHSALAYLLDRINYERTSQIPYRTAEFRLDRMRELVRRLGDPHLKIPIVHIAGTKGKGSTATMIAAILQAAGYRTGLYTSPHLERIEERFVIDAAPCSPAEFVELVQALAPVLAEMDAAAEASGARGPTFFEATTAMAMLHFARRPVDLAVLEVGLGGRLDSTNVCRPALCVITSISFDHTRQLGNTLAAIAGEKAGIVKLGVPVISGVIEAEARDTIRAAAERQHAPLWERDRDYRTEVIGGGGLAGPVINYSDQFEDRAWRLDEVAVNLLGDHQAVNAAAAIAAVRQLRQQGWNISDDAVRAGLAGVRCPARVEIMGREPTVVLDTAHNLASIAALCQTLRSMPPTRSHRVLIFSASRDKDAAGMLRLLWPLFDEIILTRYVNNPRARLPEELLTLARAELDEARPRIRVSPDPLDAWQTAQRLADQRGLICVTGSFFLAAELRPVVSGDAQRSQETQRPFQQ